MSGKNVSKQSGKVDMRQDRLKAALKSNLQRRKAQASARSAQKKNKEAE